MSTIFSLIIALVAAAHILLIMGVVVNHRKREVCICGHRFNLPKIGKFICSSCGKTHLTGTQ